MMLIKNRKIIMLACMACFVPYANAVITRISSNSRELLKTLAGMGTKFADTRSGQSTGPNINSLQRPGRIFYANMDSFGMDRLFKFETQQDANAIQRGVCDGGGMSATWYYLDTK